MFLHQSQQPIGARQVIVVNESNEFGATVEGFGDSPVAREGDAPLGLFDDMKGERQVAGQPIAERPYLAARRVVHHDDLEPRWIEMPQFDPVQRSQQSLQQGAAITGADGDSALHHVVALKPARDRGAGPQATGADGADEIRRATQPPDGLEAGSSASGRSSVGGKHICTGFSRFFWSKDRDKHKPLAV